MFDQFETGPVVTLAFLLTAFALAVFGVVVALAWGHRGGWVIAIAAVYSLKLFRDFFRRKEVR